MSICVISCSSPLCLQCTKYVVSYKTSEGGLRCAMEINDLCNPCMEQVCVTEFHGLMDKFDNPEAYCRVFKVSPWLRALTWQRRYRTAKRVAWWLFVWATWIVFFILTILSLKGDLHP